MKKLLLFACSLVLGLSAGAQNLLQNSDFGVKGDLISGSKYKIGTPWVWSIGSANIRVESSSAATKGGNVLIWRGSGNNNYISQPVAAEAGAAYEVTISQVAFGNAYANFNVGIGTAAGKYDVASGVVRLGTDNNGVKTVKLLMPTSVDATEFHFTFANTPTNTASSGIDPVTQIDYIEMQALDATATLAYAKEVALANLPTAGEGIFNISQDDLDAAKTAINAATTRSEIDAIVAGLTIPALSGEWAILNATNGLYLGEAVLSAESQTATFEKANNGFYIKINEKYINMKGGNTWSMSADDAAKTAWTFTLADGKYTITGPNGLIGTDATSAGSAVYGNKAVGNNGYWLIVDLLQAAKDKLLEEVNNFVVPTTNIGTGVFQFDPEAMQNVKDALAAAKAVAQSSTSTMSEVQAQQQILKDLYLPALNAPTVGTAYKMVQNSLSLNPETNSLSSTESALWFEAVIGGYKIKSNTGKYIKYEGSNNWIMTTTDVADDAAVFVVKYTADKGLTFKSTNGLYGGDNNTDGATMYGDKGTDKYVFWSVSEVVVTNDYSTLNAAITAAEAVTLGFEDGEFAPYNNIDALVALSTAKAVNQEVSNVASVVETITSNLNGATWTPNDGSVAIVYNGNMTEMDGTSPKGWNGAGWGQQENAVDGKKVYYFNSARTVQYGVVEGYTMPLKANTVYQLTYSYGSQGNNSCKGLPVSVKFGDTEVKTYDAGAFGTLYGTDLKTVVIKFTTEDAGNYTLNFKWNGNVGITDVEVIKVPVTEIAGTKVTKANEWGTFISEIDRELPTGLKAYSCSELSEKTLTIVEASAIKANTPYILQNESENDITIDAENAQSLKENDSYTVGLLTGVYTATEAPAESYVLQKHDDVVGFYQVGSVVPTVGANRCYLTASSDARVLTFGGEETAIKAIDALTSGKAEIFDLNGRRLNSLQKGINIVNGVKILVK